MSQKWRRSLAWDDEFFPPWATPAKMLLRAFSSISLAVVLLSGIALFGVLASVPVGILFKAPTYALYGVTILIAVALVTVPSVAGVRALVPSDRRASRIAATILVSIAAAAVGMVLWSQFAWPHLRYDRGTGEGVMLFADTIDRYRDVTVRRMPAFEMTELEFYSWWPMQLMLILFVANMAIATLRRIEFKFVNIGVLTVHTGIITIALGSLYYAALKREGDTILIAGPPSQTGEMTPGPWQSLYYDGIRIALHVRAESERWFQLPLRNVPRYNDYNLDGSVGETAWQTFGAPFERDPVLAEQALGPISILAPRPPQESAAADLSFELVATYAMDDDPVDWLRVPPEQLGAIQRGTRLNPLREVRLAVPPGVLGEGMSDELSFFLLPRSPRHRIAEAAELALEYAPHNPQRISDLARPLPAGTAYALVVEVPSADGNDGYAATIPIATLDGQLFSGDIPIGETGFTLSVDDIEPVPSLPIITSGYEGATSSLAKVRVTGNGESYQRFVYHRFPELNQDIFDQPQDDGRPNRRDADNASIRLGLIDATRVQIYAFEQPDGTVEVVRRLPGGDVARFGPIEPDARIEGLIQGAGDDRLDLELGARWAHAEAFPRPRLVPKPERENDRIGNHDAARLAVRVTSASWPGWERIVWLPFARYVEAQQGEMLRDVRLPDGRRISMAFGRFWRQFPGFRIRMDDFQLVEYEHRGAPRDYQSTISVAPPKSAPDAFGAYRHTVKLNAPLRAPFNVYDNDMNPIAKLLGRLASGLNPNQFKLAQAGWDPSTWNRTQAQVDAGELERPYAAFTILHIGNNPGIHVIAFGGVLMAVGIPWAFYVKPWLVKRKSAKLRALHAGKGTAKKTSASKPAADESLDGPSPTASNTQPKEGTA